MPFRVQNPIGFFILLALLPSPASAVVADRILAVVNNEVISLSDVRKYREVFEESREADDAGVLNELINQQLFLAEAKKLEISPPSEDEVSKTYQQLRLRFGRPETFELLKGRLILSDAEIEQQIRRRLWIDKLVQQRITFFVFATPEEVEAYYQEHSDDFKNQAPEAARKTIQDVLMREKARLKLKNYLERLRSKAVIRINRPLPE